MNRREFLNKVSGFCFAGSVLSFIPRKKKENKIAVCYITPDTDIYPEYIKEISYKRKLKTQVTSLFRGEKDISKIREALKDGWKETWFEFVWKGEGAQMIRWEREWSSPYDIILFNSFENAKDYIVKTRPIKNRISKRKISEYLADWNHKCFAVDLISRKIIPLTLI